MFENDSDRLFQDANRDGVFDVINLQAVDIAIRRLQEVVYESLHNSGDDSFVIIEFSRNDYEHAFTLFDPKFLRNACYLYLHTTRDICKERVRERADRPEYEDDYPVSGYIFEMYYHSDDGKDLPKILKKYGVDEQQVLTLPNDESFEAIISKIQNFVASTLLDESEEQTAPALALSAV